MSGATSLIVSLTGYLAIFNSSSLRQNDKFGTRVAFAEEWKATKNAAAEIFISTAVVARVLFQQTVQPVEDEYNRAIEEIRAEEWNLIQQVYEARDDALAALEEN